MGIILGTGPQKDGVLALADGLRAWLTLPFVTSKCAQEKIRVPVVGRTGWRQREQQLNASPEGANRVLLLPGDASGNLGAFRMPDRPPVGYGGNPRVLWTWDRIVTASIWSYDPTAPDDEEAQINAASQLLELVAQGLDKSLRVDADGNVEVAGTGAITLLSVRRDPSASINLPYGIEQLLTFEHAEPLYDMPSDVITDVSLVLVRELQS